MDSYLPGFARCRSNGRFIAKAHCVSANRITCILKWALYGFGRRRLGHLLFLTIGLLFFFSDCDRYPHRGYSERSGGSSVFSAPKVVEHTSDSRPLESQNDIHGSAESLAVSPRTAETRYSFFRESSLWTGIHTGASIAKANFMQYGTVFGASGELFLGRYGIWGSIASGQTDSKQYQLSTQQYSILFKESGNFGFVNARVGVLYNAEVSKRWQTNFGIGVEYSRYNTSFVSLGPAYSLVIMPGATYELSRNFALGFQVPVTFMALSSISANNNNFQLSQSERAMVAQFVLVLKYRIK